MKKNINRKVIQAGMEQYVGNTDSKRKKVRK